MKLEEGRSYGLGFLVLLGLWVVLSIVGFLLRVGNPPFFGFGMSVICLVMYQAYSGVALDGLLVASISKSKGPVFFYLFLLGQTAIAAVALYSAF